MSNFGKTLFGGSGFVRWSLTPFVLLFAILMPVMVEDWTLKMIAMMGGMELMCLALLGGFWLPTRAFVFLAYASYVLFEFFLSNGRPRNGGSGATPLNALLGFVVIGLPSLWFALRGRFTLRDEPSPDQLAAARQDYEALILKPDWALYERHLQRPAPAALRELYADRRMVTDGGLNCGDKHIIGTFEALNETGLLDTQDQLGFGIIPLATSDCGDPIYLRPGPSESDIVYITYHDGGDTEVLAQSVAAMLEELRKAKRAPY